MSSAGPFLRERDGEHVARRIFPHLNEARESAPNGELSQFSGLAVANQYRVPYGLSLEIVPEGSTVLDWGCGDGHFSYFLLQAGYNVVAYSLQHLPHVLRTLPVSLSRRFRYVQGDLSQPTKLPFPDASFDAVFSVGVLEHVREMGGTEVGSLLEIRRILRPTGRFLCFHLPNKYSYIEALNRVLHSGQRRSDAHDFHQFRYATRDVRELCEQSGLVALLRGRYALFPRNVLARLPKAVRDSREFSWILNRVDEGLGYVLRVVCQNVFFIARPGDRAGAVVGAQPPRASSPS